MVCPIYPHDRSLWTEYNIDFAVKEKANEATLFQNYGNVANFSSKLEGVQLHAL